MFKVFVDPDVSFEVIASSFAEKADSAYTWFYNDKKRVVAAFLTLEIIAIFDVTDNGESDAG